MGLLDSMKDRLGPAKDRVSDLAQRHEGRIRHGLDKAARVVDERTGGKYSDRIQRGTGRAKEAVDRLAHKGGPGAGAHGPVPEADTDGSAPPPSAPPPVS
ncbi:antitoxin [Streptomyces sp. NPDC051041]|uniref:antitoxin n=1 Tax=Streptomyces sp. NPDC051041 TaxID=3365640 RepID=UPI00378F6554